MKIANSTANAGVDAICARFNSGTLEFRTGAAPLTADDTITGTLLGTLTFGSTAFAGGVNGVATANAITQDSSADNTGTAGYAVGKNSGGATVALFTVGGTAQSTSGDIQLITTAIVAGQPIQITSFTITQPKG